MKTEIEAKFLNISPDKLREKLRALGAKLLHAERAMRRKVFDFPNNRLGKEGAWVRVRDEGDKITQNPSQEYLQPALRSEISYPQGLPREL